jgi:hypothetical protein
MMQMEKLPLSIAKKLQALHTGAELPGSQLSKTWLKSLQQEGIIDVQYFGRTKTRLRLSSKEALVEFLQNRFHITDINAYVQMMEQDEVSGSQAQQVASNTKLGSSRTFKGFLINVLQPIYAKLHGKSIEINPQPGAFTFIYDYADFALDKDVLIIGMENPENFRQIELQKHLFPKGPKLFVSRYPQNKDLLKWLQNIPNPYLHFGDFDLAGIDIFQREYFQKLGSKASFFIPDDIDERIAKKGSRALYNQQHTRFKHIEGHNAQVQGLIDIIHKNKKGLEQEGLIGGG